MTPDEAAALVNRLGDAFASCDTDAVLAEFATDENIMYAGSEADEVAVGPAELRRLLTSLFARDERYLWRCESLHLAHPPTGAGVIVLAETRLFVLPIHHLVDTLPTTSSLSYPYRISGLAEPTAGGRWCWRFCHGSDVQIPEQAGTQAAGCVS